MGGQVAVKTISKHQRDPVLWRRDWVALVQEIKVKGRVLLSRELQYSLAPLKLPVSVYTEHNSQHSGPSYQRVGPTH